MNTKYGYILFFLWFFTGFIALAQQAPLPCATTEGKVKWLDDYQQNKAAYPKSGDMLYVPTKIHLVGSDDGTGYFELVNTLRAFCELNEDFLPANIQFYMQGGINYINNSTYNIHNFGSGYDMMEEHNVSNAINCYIVADPAGACGYSIYGVGIALKKSCTGEGSTTWAHEFGHQLSLPHTFVGWEGEEVTPGEPAPNFIGNRQVEKVNGSNCGIAADGFCDTPADYLSYRWQCNGQGQSNVQQLDPDSVAFRSDATLYMSYSSDACMGRFSDEQIDAMRANLMTVRANLIANPPPPNLIPDSSAAQLLLPENGTLFPAHNQPIELAWEPVPNATGYIIQVSPLASFSLRKEYVTSTPQLMLTGLDTNRNYRWKVTAFNAFSSCIAFSETGNFLTGNLTSTATLASVSDLRVAPNPVSKTQPLQISFRTQQAQRLDLRLLSATGQEMIAQHYALGAGEQQLTIPALALPAGVYILRLSDGTAQTVRKIVITE